eukprot:TRINITY_DN23345_c0_g1_i2.p2 TRINITY_DN23345_c0_g1~~TRINITY_DN23345_c0_g1_i2.p2  ORF type:complete len:185 (+),score=9.21 TRINITY_DN23345_c0_g1_i2:20-574(+)
MGLLNYGYIIRQILGMVLFMGQEKWQKYGWGNVIVWSKIPGEVFVDIIRVLVYVFGVGSVDVGDFWYQIICCENYFYDYRWTGSDNVFDALFRFVGIDMVQLWKKLRNGFRACLKLFSKQMYMFIIYTRYGSTFRKDKIGLADIVNMLCLKEKAFTTDTILLVDVLFILSMDLVLNLDWVVVKV